MTREELTKSIAPALKHNGFRKSKYTWHKETDDGIVVFNIQASQYGPEYYLNMGFYIGALGDEQTPPEYRCHVRQRLNHELASSDVWPAIQNWLSEYGSVQKLEQHQKNGTLPPATSRIAEDYVQQHNKRAYPTQKS